VASLSQGRTAAAQCGLFTYKSVPVIFEPPCIMSGTQNVGCLQYSQGDWTILYQINNNKHQYESVLNTEECK